MHNIIYSSKSIDLVEDTAEDVVYLSITDYRDNTHYTEDFTKENFTVIIFHRTFIVCTITNL